MHVFVGLSLCVYSSWLCNRVGYWGLMFYMSAG